MTAVGTIERNAVELRERVRVAAERSDRNPDDITIVAVSKTIDRLRMDEAYQVGFRVFGESRVQEIRQKCEVPLLSDAELHLIGPLQTNKVRQVLPYVDVLETLDREILIATLARELERAGQTLRVMIQVNVAGEAQKSGLNTDQVQSFMKAVLNVTRLQPVGFMTMAPLGADEATLRSVFGGLRLLRDDAQQQSGVDLPALSMGMSSDFETAIAEGATHIRIGRSLFGERQGSR